MNTNSNFNFSLEWVDTVEYIIKAQHEPGANVKSNSKFRSYNDSTSQKLYGELIGIFHRF